MNKYNQSIVLKFGSYFIRINLMIMHFYLSFIFWLIYYHIRHLNAIKRLCLLINIILIMFVLTYACFHIFLVFIIMLCL